MYTEDVLCLLNLHVKAIEFKLHCSVNSSLGVQNLRVLYLCKQ